MQSTQQRQYWLSKRDLAVRYGVHPRSIERWMETGKFPMGVQMPNKRWAWPLSAIEAHERNLITQP